MKHIKLLNLVYYTKGDIGDSGKSHEFDMKGDPTVGAGRGRYQLVMKV